MPPDFSIQVELYLIHLKHSGCFNYLKQYIVKIIDALQRLTHDNSSHRAVVSQTNERLMSSVTFAMEHVRPLSLF